MITASYESIRERVARGAALLDERSPGWWRHLRIESVVMVYDTTCVVSAINPDVDYAAMLNKLDVVNVGVDEPDTVVWYGFDVADDEVGDGSFESYRRLTDAWRNLIGRRQIQAGLR